MEETTFTKGKATTWYGNEIFDVLIPSDATHIPTAFIRGLMNRLHGESRTAIWRDFDKNTCFILLSDVDRFTAEFEDVFKPASIISEPMLIDGVCYVEFSVGWVILEPDILTKS